jgi:hypothetical protein
MLDGLIHGTRKQTGKDDRNDRHAPAVEVAVGVPAPEPLR